MWFVWSTFAYDVTGRRPCLGGFPVVGEVKVNRDVGKVTVWFLHRGAEKKTLIRRNCDFLVLSGLNVPLDFLKTRSVKHSVSILEQSLFLPCVNTDKESLLSSLAAVHTAISHI